MKLVIAYIQPERLEPVKKTLGAAGVHHISVTNALGCGSQKGYVEHYRGADLEINLLKKVRLEIAVNDDFEQVAVDAIIEGCRTEKIGDGKIFVLDLPRVVRVRTGEEGPDAIG